MNRSKVPACAALDAVAALASGTLNARAICATSCGFPLSWRCLRMQPQIKLLGAERALRAWQLATQALYSAPHPHCLT